MDGELHADDAANLGLGAVDGVGERHILCDFLLPMVAPCNGISGWNLMQNKQYYQAVRIICTNMYNRLFYFFLLEPLWTSPCSSAFSRQRLKTPGFSKVTHLPDKLLIISGWTHILARERTCHLCIIIPVFSRYKMK